MAFSQDMLDFTAQVRPAWQLTSAQLAACESLAASGRPGFTAEAQRAQLDYGLYWALVDRTEAIAGVFYFPLDLPVCAFSPIDFTYVLPPSLQADWNYRNVEAVSILLAAVTAEINGWIDHRRRLYFEPGGAGHLGSLRMTGMRISPAWNPRTQARLWSLPYEAVPGLAARVHAFMTYRAVSGGLAGKARIGLNENVAYGDVVRQIAGGQRFPSRQAVATHRGGLTRKISEALVNLRPAS